MRVVFMGTPAFAVPSLRKLAAAHEVALVSRVRTPCARARPPELEPSPVKEAALELDLPVMEANRMTPGPRRLALPSRDLCRRHGCILPVRCSPWLPWAA